jgi:hypothetical protein
MLRTLLIATALLTASGAALAHGDDGYGRVITVEPRVSIAFGTGYPDGFRVLYESGGSRYWTYTPYRPRDYIVLPAHHRVRYVERYRDYGHGWDDRRGRDDYRDGWRGDRREYREYREDRGEYRRHGRD